MTQLANIITEWLIAAVLFVFLVALVLQVVYLVQLTREGRRLDAELQALRQQRDTPTVVTNNYLPLQSPRDFIAAYTRYIQQIDKTPRFR